MIGIRQRGIDRAKVLWRCAQVLQSLYGGRQVAERVVTSETVNRNQQRSRRTTRSWHSGARTCSYTRGA